MFLLIFIKILSRKIGGFKSKIFVFPNPINLQIKNSNLKKKTSLCMLVGFHEKGTDKLIESFVKANLGSTSLKIVGDGPLLKELKIKYKSNHNIYFLGAKANQTVLDLIDKSIAVVTATRLYEGQPTLLCEASSLGVPSIFPRSGGIEEFFPDNYSLSLNQFDYKDLENKLKSVTSKETLTKIGDENKNYILNFLSEKNL